MAVDDASSTRQLGSTETTVELVARVRAGDQSAAETLIERSLPSLKRWAHGRLPLWARDSLDTQDLVQETVLHVLRRLDTFEPRHSGALQAYLRQSVINRIRDLVRKAQRRQVPIAEASYEETSEPSPLEQAIGADQAAHYEEALASLTPEERELIVARVELAQSFQEVAMTFGLKDASAARMAVTRALRQLANRMK